MTHLLVNHSFEIQDARNQFSSKPMKYMLKMQSLKLALLKLFLRVNNDIFKCLYDFIVYTSPTHKWEFSIAYVWQYNKIHKASTFILELIADERTHKQLFK